jgi:hypothetical protein
MLRLKQAEQRQHVQTEQRRLDRVEVRLRQLEQEDVMLNYKVVLRKVNLSWWQACER